MILQVFVHIVRGLSKEILFVSLPQIALWLLNLLSANVAPFFKHIEADNVRCLRAWTLQAQVK